jgi:hypothetical protein
MSIKEKGSKIETTRMKFFRRVTGYTRMDQTTNTNLGKSLASLSKWQHSKIQITMDTRCATNGRL